MVLMKYGERHKNYCIPTESTSSLFAGKEIIQMSYEKGFFVFIKSTFAVTHLLILHHENNKKKKLRTTDEEAK